jgi:photosystem II PsbU protein
MKLLVQTFGRWAIRAILGIAIGWSAWVGWGFTTTAPAAWAQMDQPEEAPAAVVGAPAPAMKESAEKALETKIDINNTILRNYRKIPGLYPTLARLMVQNAPYERVEDVLKIPGLTEAQKQRLKDNLGNFYAGEYKAASNTLENRINKGYYD